MEQLKFRIAQVRGGLMKDVVVIVPTEPCADKVKRSLLGNNTSLINVNVKSIDSFIEEESLSNVLQKKSNGKFNVDTVIQNEAVLKKCNSVENTARYFANIFEELSWGDDALFKTISNDTMGCEALKTISNEFKKNYTKADLYLDFHQNFRADSSKIYLSYGFVDGELNKLRQNVVDKIISDPENIIHIQPTDLPKLVVTKAADVDSECRIVLQDVLKILLNGNTKPSEIAILYNFDDNYKSTLTRLFKEAGVEVKSNEKDACEITIGSIENYSCAAFKHLYIVGVNEKIAPFIANEDPVITEKIKASSARAFLTGNEVTDVQEHRFRQIITLNQSIPDASLALSYPNMTLTGSENTISRWVSNLQATEGSPASWIKTMQDGEKVSDKWIYLHAGLPKKTSPEQIELGYSKLSSDYLSSKDELNKARGYSTSNVVFGKYTGDLSARSKEITEAMKDFIWSPSRFEAYLNNPFWFFMNYILRVKEPNSQIEELTELDAMDAGTLRHKCLEYLTTEEFWDNKSKKFLKTPDIKAIDSVVTTALSDILDEKKADAQKPEEKYRVKDDETEDIQDILCDWEIKYPWLLGEEANYPLDFIDQKHEICNTLQKWQINFPNEMEGWEVHSRESGFTSKQTEENKDYYPDSVEPIEIGSTTIDMNGKVDRIDVSCDDTDKQKLRIIDYKSSSDFKYAPLREDNKKPGDLDRYTASGSLIQLGIYAIAYESMENIKVNEVEYQLFNKKLDEIPTKIGFYGDAEMKQLQSEVLNYVSLIVEAVESGFFPYKSHNKYNSKFNVDETSLKYRNRLGSLLDLTKKIIDENTSIEEYSNDTIQDVVTKLESNTKKVNSDISTDNYKNVFKFNEESEPNF